MFDVGRFYEDYDIDTVGIKNKMKRKRNCKAKNCHRFDIEGKGYCKKHYERQRQGKDPNAKTIKDRNDYIEYDDYIEILLRNKKHEEIARTIIDKEDKWLLRYKWHLHNNNYASAYIQGNTRRHLHQFLFPERKETDHKNRNRLDNRKQNLRECTSQQNMMNKNVYKNNKCNITGIGKDGNKWRARITVENKTIHLGKFKEIDDAITARKEAEKKYFKEFAPGEN